MIRPVRQSDAAQIAAIYNHYVATSTISFEEDAVSEAEMVRRIRDVSAVYPWYVEVDGADDGDADHQRVLGYAYATAWKARSAYRFSVESTVYLDPACRARGVGRRLYAALLAELRERGVHLVLAGIALPNPASIALHERCGFVKVAHLEQVGRKFDTWVDVGYWQLLLSGS